MKLKHKIGEKLSNGVETIFQDINESLTDFCVLIEYFNSSPYIFEKKLNEFLVRSVVRLNPIIKIISHSYLDYELFIEISIDNTILYLNLEFELIYYEKWNYEYNTVILTDNNGVILYDIIKKDDGYGG